MAGIAVIGIIVTLAMTAMSKDFGRDRGYRHSRSYRHDCRDNGTGGAIIGAIAGGLLGNEVAGRGDRTTGTVVGAAVGAIAGHAIDKGNDRC